jgi:bacterioferritin-associated ferredoxin
MAGWAGIMNRRAATAHGALARQFPPARTLFFDRHLNLDDTICYCFHVPKRKILNFIRIHQPRRASQISECGGAGTGCGWCVPYLKRYFEEAQAGKVSDPDKVTPDEYARMRANYIRDGKGTPPPGAIPLPPE